METIVEQMHRTNGYHPLTKIPDECSRPWYDGYVMVLTWLTNRHSRVVGVGSMDHLDHRHMKMIHQDGPQKPMKVTLKKKNPHEGPELYVQHNMSRREQLNTGNSKAAQWT